MKCLPVCASFVFAFCLLIGPVLAADNNWTNGTGDGLWNTAGNWSPTVIPYFGNVTARINSVPGPFINSGMEGDCQWVIIGDSDSADLTVNGGDLCVFDFVTYSGDSGIIIANTASSVGTLTMNAGSLATGEYSGDVYVGYKGQGTLRMNGGNCAIQGLLGIGYCDTSTATGKGYVYLNGGTIVAEDLQMASPAGCTGLLDISSGTLGIYGDKTALINSHIAAGRIVACGGSGTVAVDYDITNPGQTTVKALVNPQQASNPLPGYSNTNIPLDVNLSWTPGSGATSHKIYFGTSNPPAFIGTEALNSFHQSAIDYNTTYYWRIDEVSGANTVTGLIWKFTTTDGVTANPDPVNNGSQNVSFDKVLGWVPGYGATSHDIYFGTDAAAVAAAQRLPGDLDADGQVDYEDLSIIMANWQSDPSGCVPFAGVNQDDIVNFDDYAILCQNWMGKSTSVFIGNISDASFDPVLVPEADYYWRVDERNGGNAARGPVWSFTTRYTLFGKVMAGYQGWFNCPGDGTDIGWSHWTADSDGGHIAPNRYNVNVDLWPDMTEMTAGEKFLVGNFYDGLNHYVFSSHNSTTVQRHFQWMRDYGIDGIYLQRFAVEVIRQADSSFSNRNHILDYCKSGANMYGRKYAVMYDLSGMDAGQMQSVINDWKYLCDTKHVTRDAADYAYMRHRGKPVVAVWGIGFTDWWHPYTWSECLALINFLKDDPTYGGNTVMIGVNDNWRSLATDPTLFAICKKADIISPWSVGRYKNNLEINNFLNDVWLPDIQWCKDNSTPSHPIEYLPVVWPGFSWSNMHWNMPGYPLNQYPRTGGQFLWNQVYAAVASAHASMLYIAMFDEVDEGTAIFKIATNPPRPGGVDMFITPGFDGNPALPSDEYLWLTGQAGKALRSEIPLNTTRPSR